MWQQILPGLRIKIFMTVLLGVVYPLAITGIASWSSRTRRTAASSRSGGKVIGSELIGQSLHQAGVLPAARRRRRAVATMPERQQRVESRPDQRQVAHGTTKTDDKKNEVVDFDGISLRVLHYCLDNDIPYESSVPLDQFRDASGNLDDVKLIKAFNDENTPLRVTAKALIPADAVTASASGLDPHISPANAEAQANRVAKARQADPGQVKQLIAGATEGADLGILGEARVNVLRLNLALDQRFPVKH